MTAYSRWIFMRGECAMYALVMRLVTLGGRDKCLRWVSEGIICNLNENLSTSLTFYITYCNDPWLNRYVLIYWWGTSWNTVYNKSNRFFRGHTNQQMNMLTYTHTTLCPNKLLQSRIVEGWLKKVEQHFWGCREHKIFYLYSIHK